MAEVDRRRLVVDDVGRGRNGEVIPLFRRGDDDELALLVACGATIEQIARRLGRDLEEVFRELLALKLALDEESAHVPERPGASRLSGSLLSE